MWCAFEGPPTVLRVHGRGEPIFRDDPRFATLAATLADADDIGVRAIILVTAERISDSCGFAVPLMDYQADRTMLAEFFGRKGEDGFAAYCATKEYNAESVDGLPALPLPLPGRPVSNPVSSPNSSPVTAGP
jgi:hypothetical protein